MRFEDISSNGEYIIHDTETDEVLYSISSIIDKLNSLNDDFHTIQELYEFRLLFNALLFNKWYEDDVFEVYKSKRHHDGELCFEGDFFIVIGLLPDGQISNHYPIEFWDFFKIPSYDKVKDVFDGHSSKDVLYRLKQVL